MGCGGGSSGGGNTATITGLTAEGAALANADILIKGRLGLEASGVANGDGEFSIDVTELTSPYILRATTQTRVLYSYASTATNTNITPITTIILSQSVETGTSLQSIFNGFSELSISSLENNLRTALQEMNTAIDDQNFESFDHFSDTFKANGIGYDGILDSLNFAYQNGSIVIKNSSNVIMIGTNDTNTLTESNNGSEAGKFTSLTGKVVDGSTKPSG